MNKKSYSDPKKMRRLLDVIRLILNEYIKRYCRANAKEASGEQSNQRTMGHPHSETLKTYKAEKSNS